MLKMCILLYTAFFSSSAFAHGPPEGLGYVLVFLYVLPFIIGMFIVVASDRLKFIVLSVVVYGLCLLMMLYSGQQVLAVAGGFIPIGLIVIAIGMRILK